MHNEEMDKLAITFKHLILEMDKKGKAETKPSVTVADIADLMETLQSCLLRYWEYNPSAEVEEERSDQSNSDGNEQKSEGIQSARKVEIEDAQELENEAPSRPPTGDIHQNEGSEVFKKKPIVFLIDEAHKLPALVDDQLSLKVFLDTLLVLTKQDRLCHVILSTSDSFFQHFLRSMNVGHHSQLITIGDCTKEETRQFFEDEIVPTLPDKLRTRINFDEVYAAFGGKLSHISDYMSVWVNEEGEDITPLKSAMFTQAYTLLQFHLTHESFDTYSPLTTSTAWSNNDDESQFTRNDLTQVMRKLVKPPYSLPYFDLCRQIGTAQTDAMIKTRVLELRWTRTVSPEQDWVERVWSKDGVERPIVLPMTRIVRKAMEIALMEEDGRDRRVGAEKFKVR
jgi:hypothetical protein